MRAKHLTFPCMFLCWLVNHTYNIQKGPELKEYNCNLKVSLMSCVLSRKFQNLNCPESPACFTICFSFSISSEIPTNLDHHTLSTSAQGHCTVPYHNPSPRWVHPPVRKHFKWNNVYKLRTDKYVHKELFEES